MLRAPPFCRYPIGLTYVRYITMSVAREGLVGAPDARIARRLPAACPRVPDGSPAACPRVPTGCPSVAHGLPTGSPGALRVALAGWG
jgi:hypothetical protein